MIKPTRQTVEIPTGILTITAKQTIGREFTRKEIKEGIWFLGDCLTPQPPIRKPENPVELHPHKVSMKGNDRDD